MPLTPGATALDPLAWLGRLDPDAVIDLSAYTPNHCSTLLEALPQVPRWVQCSSGAVYAPVPTLPWVEDGPLGPWPMWGTYARNKLECEDLLRERRPAGSVTVVLRPPYVLGPGNYANRKEFILNRILDEQPIFVPGSGNSALHIVSSRDLAAIVSRCLTADVGPGFAAVNAATDTLCTSNGLIELCAEVAGKAARPVRVLEAKRVGSFDRVDYLFPFPDAPYVLSTRKARDLGLVADLDDLPSLIRASLQCLLEKPARRTWSPSPTERAVRAGRLRARRVRPDPLQTP